jgi:hypothetical protein
MDELTDFLNARLAEDEATANAMQHVAQESAYYSCPATRTGPLGDLEWGEENCDCGLAARKGRALREVAADRRLLAELEKGAAAAVAAPDNPAVLAAAEALLWAASIRAAVWGDHPDYRSEWAP